MKIVKIDPNLPVSTAKKEEDLSIRIFQTLNWIKEHVDSVDCKTSLVDQITSNRFFNTSKKLLSNKNKSALLRVDTQTQEPARDLLCDVIDDLPYTFIKCERFIFLGLLICIYEYCYHIVMMPTLAFYYVFKFIKNSFYTLITRRKFVEELDSKKLYHVMNIVICGLVGVAFNHWVSVTAVYHNLRTQGMFKLYVLYNMLDLAGRVWRSIEREVLINLFSCYIDVFQRGKNKKIACLFKTLLGSAIVGIHSFIHLIRGLLLFLSLRDSKSAMFLFMFTCNWNEIKSTILKKQSNLSLYRLLSSDIIERYSFTLDIWFALIYIITDIRFPHTIEAYFTLIKKITLMIVIELMVDNFKYAVLLKFNGIKNNVFSIFEKLVALDFYCAQFPELNLLINKKFKTNPVRLAGLCPYPKVVSDRLGFNSVSIVAFSISIFYSRSEFTHWANFAQLLLLVLFLLLIYLLAASSIAKILKHKIEEIANLKERDVLITDF